jgi:Domain of unknown function (DUF4399)/Family of unknown function (DUF6130)
MAFRVVGALILTASIAFAACNRASQPAADHSEHAGGKVFFKEPANGAMVKSPVHIVFGSDMFTIAPVPEGEVTTVRANTGHYHLGVDTDCLAAGSVIPKANPWVHFGKGNDNIDMQLTPGPHKLVVQAGDDKHATMTGLCEVINVTVTE